MQITYDTEKDGYDEARALVSMLAALYGADTLPEAGGTFRFARQSEPVTGAPDGFPTPPPADNNHVADEAPSAETDSAGTPWDERIHSSSKGTNKDGTWTRRRNTPDATYEAVMGELAARTASAGNAKQDTPTLSPQGSTPADGTQGPSHSGPSATNDASPSESAAAAFGNTAAGAATANPAAPPPSQAANTVAPPPPPPPPAAEAVPLTFPKLMIKVTNAQNAGKITKEQIAEMLEGVGLTAMPQLVGKPDLIAQVGDIVDAYANG